MTYFPYYVTVQKVLAFNQSTYNESIIQLEEKSYNCITDYKLVGKQK